MRAGTARRCSLPASRPLAAQPTSKAPPASAVGRVHVQTPCSRLRQTVWSARRLARKLARVAVGSGPAVEPLLREAPVMSEGSWVGLDVHARSVVAGVIDAGGGGGRAQGGAAGAGGAGGGAGAPPAPG